MLFAELTRFSEIKHQWKARDIQAVPVLPNPRQSTFIGTTLSLFRLLMFVAGFTSPTVVSFAFSIGFAMISVLDQQKKLLDLLLTFPSRGQLLILAVRWRRLCQTG